MAGHPPVGKRGKKQNETPEDEDVSFRDKYLGVFQYSWRAIELVWSTNRTLTLLFAALTLVAGLMPAGLAYVGKLIVDQVLTAAEVQTTEAQMLAFTWVALEAGLVAMLAAIQRGLSVVQSLLRQQLGHRVNTMILEKALTLNLAQFEDSEFYDKLTRARRRASSTPLSLVQRTFQLGQNAIGLVTAGALLWQFSPWAVLVLFLAGLPAFMVEAKFSGEAFRLFRWRSPESRKQMYIETVLAREDYAKEVKLFGIGDMLLERYRDIFRLLYAEDKSLTLRRGIWGYVLGLLSTAAFYGAYAWVVYDTTQALITLGEMTMYLALFKQGQGAVSASLNSVGGMYEDNLYLSTLYELLEEHHDDRVLIFTNDNDSVYQISREVLCPTITHQTPVKERKEILARFNEGAYKTIATSKVLNEGVDVPEARVAVVLSGSGSVREHVQRLGRILRRAPDKKALLYELVTDNSVETYVSQRRREHDAYQ